jgi:hypothetical protein
MPSARPAPVIDAVGVPRRLRDRLQVLTLQVPVGEKLQHPLFHPDPALI